MWMKGHTNYLSSFFFSKKKKLFKFLKNKIKQFVIILILGPFFNGLVGGLKPRLKADPILILSGHCLFFNLLSVSLEIIYLNFLFFIFFNKNNNRLYL